MLIKLNKIDKKMFSGAQLR